MNNWEKGQNGLKGLLSAGVPNSVFGNSRKPNYSPTTLSKLSSTGIVCIFFLRAFSAALGR